MISKVVGFYLKVTDSLGRGVGVFRLFMTCFRFFHEELSLMPTKALIRFCTSMQSSLRTIHATKSDFLASSEAHIRVRTSLKTT